MEDMFQWVDTSDLDRLREHREALKIERAAWRECHSDRMWLRDKITRIRRLVEAVHAGDN